MYFTISTAKVTFYYFILKNKFYLLDIYSIKMSSLESVDKSVYDFFLWYAGKEKYLDDLFLPTEENLQKALKIIRGYRKDLEKANRLDSFEEVWSGQLNSLIDALEIVVQENHYYPNRFYAALIDSLKNVFSKYCKNMEYKNLLITKLGKSTELIEPIETLCEQVDNRCIDETLKMMRQLNNALEEIISSDDYKIIKKSKELKNKILESIKKIEKLKSVERKIKPDISFREIVTKKWALDLDWILSWYEEEEQKCLRDFRELTYKINPNKSPLEVLEEVDPPIFQSAEEMIDEAKKYLKIARENALDFISFPEGERLSDEPVIDVPERRRHELAWGASVSGEDLEGKVQLNLQNYDKITRGWIQNMAIHEVYPGHYLHSAKISTRDLPHAFELGSGMSPLLETRLGRWISEGLAHRAESLFGDVYGEGILPLHASYRRVHCSTRALIDIWLFYLCRSEDDCVKKYMENMGWSEEESRQQVNVHLNRPGVRLGFYCGLMLIDEMENGTKLTDRELNEILYSSGYVTPEVMRKVLKNAESKSENLEDM
jgi:hypothetical protein